MPTVDRYVCVRMYRVPDISIVWRLRLSIHLYNTLPRFRLRMDTRLARKLFCQSTQTLEDSHSLSRVWCHCLVTQFENGQD